MTNFKHLKAKIMNWKAKIITHKGESRIAIVCKFEPRLIDMVRDFYDVRWSQRLKLWHVPNTEENRYQLGVDLPIIHHPTPEGYAQIEKFGRWLASRRYSESTVKSYLEAVRSFLTFYNDRPIATLTNADVITYNNDHILKNKLSASYQNQIVNALKLFFRIIDDRLIDPELIHRPKRAKLLPNILSKAEVKAILDAPINNKHCIMLSLIYACGLRRSELLNLEFSDIQADRHLLVVRQSKGKKDRIVPLSDKVIEMLREYFRRYRPKRWLFEGHNPGQQFSEQGLQSAFKRAVARAEINKPVTLHWLRHSYATHLLESGTDLHYIQELLGHNSSRTTEIYTHVTTKSLQNIRSPFDDL